MIVDTILFNKLSKKVGLEMGLETSEKVVLEIGRQIRLKFLRKKN